ANRIDTESSGSRSTLIDRSNIAIRNEPRQLFHWRGSRSCASCDQDGDDEEGKKATEPAGLAAAEVQQHEPDQKGDTHSRSPSGAGLLQCRSPGACAMRRDWASD